MGIVGNVDHEDRSKLNNQRYNLRPATGSQNNVNCPIRSHNSSGYTGVSPFKYKGEVVGYEANISRGNKKIRLGYFYPYTNEAAMQAAYAHDIAAIRFFGPEFAFLNCVELPDDTKEAIQQDILWRITGGTEGKAKPEHVRIGSRGGRPAGSKNKTKMATAEEVQQTATQLQILLGSQK